MGKMEQESQRFSRLLLGKTNRQQETYLQKEAVVAYLPKLLMELLLWRKLLRHLVKFLE
jgi:hypothetical protein